MKYKKKLFGNVKQVTSCSIFFFKMKLRKNDNRGGEETDTETSIILKERERKEAKHKINSSR